CSVTNGVAFQYVVTKPLGLQVLGNGTVPGATNTQLLEVGRSYTLTAVPGPGFILTNWSTCGMVMLANKAVLSFVMQSNLCLRATFADVQAPTLAITNPAPSGIRVSNALVDVEGWAEDNSRVAVVWVKVNQGEYVVAESGNGWTNWVRPQQRLNLGTNWVFAYGTDAFGNRSAIATNQVIYGSPPVILAPPASQAVGMGANAAFSVVVAGAEPFGFQWRGNGQDLTDGGAISGATTTNLTIANVETNHAGLYSVVITNVFGSVTSSVAVLTVVSTPSLTIVNSTGGVPQIYLSGPAGTYCDINRSTDLVNWTSLGGVPVGAVLELDQLDPTWRALSHVFFRVAVPSSDTIPIPGGRFTMGNSQR
ncbi:MAG: immunoglobulin domain-containing protein, partial [Verrucomicrobia bacterium]|nr:immunoglobulin domain-containing protein [Verrucomicrobiota bacterium]